MIPREQAGLPPRTGIANDTRPASDVKEFIVHYGDGKTPKTEAEERAILKRYDDYHRSKGWGAVGYNLAVGPVTGKVYEARGLDRVGTHTVGHNRTGVATVLIGGKDVLTDKAKQGLKDAYKIVCDYAGQELPVYGHRDFANTDCPGDPTYAWLQTNEIKGENMSKPTVYVDGRLVAAGTAAAFKKLAAAFKKATGYSLHIRDGYRTYAQQKNLWDRWKAGTFSAPSVAPPGTSLHETGRALDVYDSGTTPGVTVAGNSRSNWLRNNAAKYGFNPAGYGFKEPWHIEYTGNPWAVSGSSGGTTVSNGGFSKAYIQDIQKRLIAKGYSVGASGADGILGNATIAAVKAFQKAVGLTADGIPGPKTLAALQAGAALAADGVFGAASVKRLQQVLGTPVDGVISGQYAGSKKNHTAITSIKYGNGGSTAIRALQRKLGYTGANVDGVLGPTTIKAWQKNLKVTADGIFGAATAKAAQKALNNGKVW